MKIAELTERAQYYYNAPPHPSDIANAKEEYKRLVNQDWKICVALYPEAMDYFFSLVDIKFPDDKHPDMNYLRQGQSGMTGRHLQELKREKEARQNGQYDSDHDGW
jgi:hypothetical protein